MSLGLKLEVAIFSLLSILVIFQIVRNGRISIKYSLVWLFSILILIVSVLIPNLMETAAKLLGFQLLSNMILCMVIVILMFVSISLTIIVSGQNEKIRLLIQEVSIIKSELGKKGGKI